jgi:hypothetical protein
LLKITLLLGLMVLSALSAPVMVMLPKLTLPPARTCSEAPV